jgi:hypothetical protein
MYNLKHFRFTKIIKMSSQPRFYYYSRRGILAQVEDYGHWILQERSGNVAGSCRKAPEIAGSGSSIPTGNLLDFFRWIPVNFLCFSAGTGRKSLEKIRKISGGNTASTF